MTGWCFGARKYYDLHPLVGFFGDHGWHPGEKLHWRKFAPWEETLRSVGFTPDAGRLKPRRLGR